MEGTQEFFDALDEIQARVNVGARSGVMKGADLVVGQARKNVHSIFSANQKGALARSIEATPPEDLGNKFAVEVTAGMIYARIQELGGTIQAKNPSGYLTFQVPSGSGNWVKVPSVTLPPRPYLQPALDNSSAGYLEILRSEVAVALGVG